MLGTTRTGITRSVPSRVSSILTTVKVGLGDRTRTNSRLGKLVTGTVVNEKGAENIPKVYVSVSQDLETLPLPVEVDPISAFRGVGLSKGIVSGV